MNASPRNPALSLPRQDPHEEIVNTITHGLGVLLSLAALATMVTRAGIQSSAWHVVGSAVFGSSLVVLYAASAIYHGLPRGHLKAVMRVVEHACIYVLIAGTYTPFSLTVIRGAWGWTLLGLVWGLALAMIVFKILFVHRHPWVWIGGYVVMGWLAVLAAKPIMESLPVGGLLWILGGGVFYTGGLLFFFLDERIRFFHVLWHLCVMAGSACHVVAVMRYVLSAP